tara:strand:+ start:441 stop:1142 length:702 start_codon:yes stop_codon:yes gene_type:complete
MIKYKRINGVESFEEVCEHCGEKVRDLHISEIIVKAKNDPRTIRVKNSSNKYEVLKDKDEYISDRRADWERKGLLDSGEKLKYKTRPESMCSESIDTETGVTSSFCYKTDNTRFLAKYSSSFHAASQLKTNITGSKVGVDRKGNIIRMRSIKNINLSTGVAEADSRVKYKGPDETLWWRKTDLRTRKTFLEAAQSCPTYIERYGKEAVYEGTVVSRYKSADEMKTDLAKNRCI